MKSFQIFLALLTLSCSFLYASNATAWRDRYPENHAYEGEQCSKHFHGQSCAPGLACEYYFGDSGEGVCRRICTHSRDCRYEEVCTQRGYGIGVCELPYDRPGYPRGRASEGERCSEEGFRYPRCEFGLLCQDYFRDGTGICELGHRRNIGRRPNTSL